MKYSILFLWCALLYGCTSSVERVHSRYPPTLINGDSVNGKFQMAEELFAKGDYQKSLSEYTRLLGEHLTETEKNYAILCEGICNQLLEKDTFLTQGLSLTRELVPLNSLYEGIKSMNEGKDAQLKLLRAEKELKQLDQTTGLPYLLTLTQLGLYHRSYSTRVDSSIYYFKKALYFTEEFDALAHYKVSILFHLAELSLMFRDTMQGLAYVHQALADSLPHEWQGRFLTLKGTMFRKLTQYDSADRCYELAEEKLSNAAKGQAFSELLREKILKAILQNDKDRFSSTINRLNSIDSSSRGPSVNLNRLYGFYYYSRGEAGKSIVHYERALQTLRKQKQYELVQMGEAYYLLIEQYRLLKDFEKAKQNCFEAMAYASPMRNTIVTIENAFDDRLLVQPHNFVLYGLLAEVFKDSFYASNNYEHARFSLRICTLIDSLILAQVKAKEEDAVINYLPYGHRAYSSGIETSYLLYQHTGDTTYIHHAHQFMEKSKSLIIYRDLLARKSEYFPDVPEEFMHMELKLKSKMAVAKKKVDSKTMTKTLAEINDYYSTMEKNYPKYYQSKFQMAIPSYSACQLLAKRKNQTIVQYHVADSAIYLLTYDDRPQFERIEMDLVLTENFYKLKQLLRAPPQLKKNEAHYFAQLSVQIYSKLFKPVAAPKHDVLIIPEGFLSQFPFETLVSDSTGSFKSLSYLVKKFRFSYAHSLKIYAMQPTAIKSGEINRILGYSHSENMPAGKMNHLPGSSMDLQSLSQTFSNSSLTFRKGERATKAQFLSDLQGPYNLIHVALHASSSFSDKYDNKIEFFSSDEKPDFLYAHELTPLKLEAQTVVLASCESSLGTHVTGEGTFNLERAFSQMGASTVISSAWQIPDQLGHRIVDGFYHYLQQAPMDMSGSLSRSKLEYLESADEYTAHPFFWASMICIENQRGLNQGL